MWQRLWGILLRSDSSKRGARGLWTSELYEVGARSLVAHLDITKEEFRNLCDSLEATDSPKERYFDALNNVHMLNNLRMFTSWGLTKQQQKTVLFAFPTLIERRTRHLESMREWYLRFFHVKTNDFRETFVSYPWLLSWTTEKQVPDILKIFLKRKFAKEHMQMLLLHAPRVFHFQPPRQVEQNLPHYMEKLSLSCEDLVEMLIKEPELLGYDYIDVTRRKIRWLMKELGLARELVVRYVLVACPDLLLRSFIEDMRENLAWLKERGVKRKHIRKLMLANPKILLRTELYNMHDELMEFKDQVGIDYF
ncbi:hypothetical protein BSKO_01221 [Bryopsis sp. KO-2023]|nr:hypothetical protein BSKO_01221 [Bryopsis sp. KO-2023]